MKQFEQCWFILMVSQIMLFTARRFLIFAAFQFVVITHHYAASCLAKNKNHRTLNPIQLRFLGSRVRPCMENNLRRAMDGYTASHTN
jgi:hypothetical protein